jgi:hypothetical protein
VVTVLRRTCLVGAAAAIAACLPALPAAAAGWVQIPAPDAPGSNFTSLPGLATVSPTEAWAVGLARNPGSTASRPVIEHWTATAGWQLTSSAATPGSSDSQLAAAAAVSPADVWAVGMSTDSALVTHGFLEHWTGSAWRQVAAAANEPAGARLAAVAAVSANDVWAVGVSQDPVAVARRTLAEHWNGTSWQVVPTPAVGGAARLNSVAAVSSTDVWAVGELDVGLPIAEHWDGLRWRQVALPPTAPPTSSASGLTSVTAVAAGDVWAVGTRQNSTHTLIEHWNGTAWAVVPSPDAPGQTNNILLAVSAFGPADVWTVGFSLQAGLFAASLAEHWDGNSWTTVASPNMPASFSTRMVAIQAHPGWPLLSVGDAQSQTGPVHAFAARFG